MGSLTADFGKQRGLHPPLPGRQVRALWTLFSQNKPSKVLFLFSFSTQ